MSEGTRLEATAPPAVPSAGGRPRRRRISSLFAPKEQIPRAASVTLALSGFGIVLALWAILSYGGIMSSFFLPSPSTVARALYSLFKNYGFASDVWASTRRIMLGFLLSAVFAIPLGIAIGSFRIFQAFFEPVIAAVRYMPASAFIPLLIIWFGIYENEKLAVIFIGVFFPLTLLIADVSANVPRELVQIAYTLGASRWQVFWRVLLPASWPGVVDNLRIGIGWAWTYLIVAELVAADQGIGHMILSASRFLQTDQIMAGIITIGALGLITDGIFRWLYRILFPYAERVGR